MSSLSVARAAAQIRNGLLTSPLTGLAVNLSNSIADHQEIIQRLPGSRAFPEGYVTGIASIGLPTSVSSIQANANGDTALLAVLAELRRVYASLASVSTGIPSRNNATSYTTSGKRGDDREERNKR